MSRLNPHRRELGPAGFALAPLLQIGFALTVTTLGTVIGDNVMKETKINFANVPTQSSLNIVAASMAVSTAALALALLLISQCFAPQKPIARYNETISNSLFITGATPFLSFLAPVIGAYLSGLPFLYDSLYIGSASALGTTPLALIIFMAMGMGKIVSNCYQPNYNPAEEPPEFTSHSTQVSDSDTHAIEINPLPIATNPLSVKRMHVRTYSTESIVSNSPVYHSPMSKRQKPTFPTEEGSAAQPQRFVLLPAPPARNRREGDDHPHRPCNSRGHHRTYTH